MLTEPIVAEGVNHHHNPNARTGIHSQVPFHYSNISDHPINDQQSTNENQPSSLCDNLDGNGSVLISENSKKKQFSPNKDPLTVMNTPALESESAAEALTEESPDPVDLDVALINVVSSFSLHCHLNLRHIATHAANVIFRREQGKVEMKLRSPPVSASLSSSGKVFQTGARSEEAAKLAARRVARILQKMGYQVKFKNYRITNVMATFQLPFGVNLRDFATNHPRMAQYEPEIHPGCNVNLTEPKCNFHIFQNGKITLTASSIPSIQEAVSQIYSMAEPSKKPRPPTPEKVPLKRVFKAARKPTGAKRGRFQYDYDEEEDEEDDLKGFIVSETDESSADETSESEAESTSSDSD